MVVWLNLVVGIGFPAYGWFTNILFLVYDLLTFVCQFLLVPHFAQFPIRIIFQSILISCFDHQFFTRYMGHIAEQVSNILCI